MSAAGTARQRAPAGDATPPVFLRVHNRPQAAWLLVGLASIACFMAVDVLPWLQNYPDAWVVPLADGISAAMVLFVDQFRGIFRAMAWLFSWPLVWVQAVFHWLPWPVVMAVFVIVGHRAGGRWLATFTAGALGYMLVVGYWSESMNTLSLVVVSVPLSLAAGLAMGIAAFRSERVDRVIQPTLDLMQTVPAFAYLIPILFLFGFGPVVGLIASAIFAAPPMVRNTILGLKQVPAPLIDSATMCGCTARQRFWQVEVPTALPQIMIGVNQSIMAALSMVIIAAIIGGFDDIGWEVLSTMRKAQFGQSLLAGLVIALLAMVLDRISRGFARRHAEPRRHGAGGAWHRRHPHLGAALIAGPVLLALSGLVPALSVFPGAWEVYPADALNDLIRHVVRNHHEIMASIKNATLFYVMLPLRIGFSQAISPFSWGLELTPFMIWSYGLGAVALAAWTAWHGRWQLAVGISVVAGLLYYGTTGTPWPVTVLVVSVIAWQAAGARIAAFCFAAMLFMLLNGIWEQAMLSLYLCAAAVLVSFCLGGLIGTWAAHNEVVSRILRPINDTLQTMPQFVLLIPILMLFQVGEFSALLAIIAYAIVPPIRYFEHGLRSVPVTVVEAARQMGCTRRQLLLEVKLPMALPAIMLGLNQTIMYALAMLVIAALVGTQGLGQQVYLALGKADMGRGLITGLSMALIAMMADRILLALSARRQRALGL